MKYIYIFHANRVPLSWEWSARINRKEVNEWQKLPWHKGTIKQTLFANCEIDMKYISGLFKIVLWSWKDACDYIWLFSVYNWTGKRSGKTKNVTVFTISFILSAIILSWLSRGLRTKSMYFIFFSFYNLTDRSSSYFFCLDHLIKSFATFLYNNHVNVGGDSICPCRFWVFFFFKIHLFMLHDHFAFSS